MPSWPFGPAEALTPTPTSVPPVRQYVNVYLMPSGLQLHISIVSLYEHEAMSCQHLSALAEAKVHSVSWVCRPEAAIMWTEKRPNGKSKPGPNLHHDTSFRLGMPDEHGYP